MIPPTKKNNLATRKPGNNQGLSPFFSLFIFVRCFPRCIQDLSPRSKNASPDSTSIFWFHRALGLLTFFLDTQLGGRCAALGGVTQQRCSFEKRWFCGIQKPGGWIGQNQSWSGGKEIGMSEWYPRPRYFNRIYHGDPWEGYNVITHIAPCFMVSGSKGNRFFEDCAFDHSISGTHFAQGQTFWDSHMLRLHDQTSLEAACFEISKKNTGG